MVATPTRHRGSAGRRHQQNGAPPIQVRPAREDVDIDEDLEDPMVFADDVYFGDGCGPLLPSYLRCALFQFGGLPTFVREPKEHEFFNIFRKYRVGLGFLQELGINWCAPNNSQQ